MKAHIWMLIFFLIFALQACTSKRGIIELYTRPPDAALYLDDIKQGISPVKFEYDFSRTATLKIEKQGYYTEIETLSEAWVTREIRKGNYTEGLFTIQGENIKAWKVTTTRLLQRKEE